MRQIKIRPKFNKIYNPRIGLITLATDFVIEKDSTETETAAIATMADDTFVTATWFIDPDRDAVYYSVNNAEPVKIANTNLPDDEELTITIAIQAGAAAAKSLVVDYVTAIIER